MKGYGGSFLRVNLTEKSINKTPTDIEFCKEYIGGRGFCAKILWDELEPGCDPFSEKNKIVVTAGPLSGLLVPGAARTHFAAKSPATLGYGDSSMGGKFGPELKYAGIDAIIFEGKSEEPVYLLIDDNNIEIRSAKEYWGKGCFETERGLKKELGEDFQITVIGPAGENLVKFSGINHDYGRQAARTGIGAVWGSKKLKAICVRGKGFLELADPKAFSEVSKAMYKEREEEGLLSWQTYGTTMGVAVGSERRTLPTRNFNDGKFESADDLSHLVLEKNHFKGLRACAACPLACGKYSYSNKYDIYIEGPEYETTALVGSSCGLTDMNDVIKINYLCDDLGMDTISTGNVIGFAMECAEKGIIHEEKLPNLHFGDGESAILLTQMLAKREGIGDILAEGVKVASKLIGSDSSEFAMDVKGLEISGYESRGYVAMMLAYMTCDVGGSHTKAWAVPTDLEFGPTNDDDKKISAVIKQQHRDPLFDMLGLCQFQLNSMELYAQMLKAATGIDYTADELMQLSEKVWNLTRCFWKREIPSFDRTWDLMPERYSDNTSSGNSSGLPVMSREYQNRLLDDYYRLRGWDKDGLPSAEKLEELKLNC